MPLCAPKKVPLSNEWLLIKEDLHFILQKSLRKKKAFRILMKCNYYQIGEFNNEKDMLREWSFLHPKEAESSFDETSKLTTNSLFEEAVKHEKKNIELLSSRDYVCLIAI